MPRSKRYFKSKVSRVVEKAQASIRKKHNLQHWVCFEEWYMTIRDNQLVVIIPYTVIPGKKFSKNAKPFTGVYTKTL